MIDRDYEQQWRSEYEAWCEEQPDEDDVNRLLNEAAYENERTD